MNTSSETRRALVRKYKDTPLPAGVYVIRNKASGRVYLAGSLDVEGALNRARFELKLGSHRSIALQRDWAELGADGFDIEVIDRVKESEDPAFDRAAELEKLLALWSEEYASLGCPRYETPSRRNRPVPSDA